jgi:hypothetical protein
LFLGLGVSFKIAIIACALLALRTAAFAQESAGHGQRIRIAQDIAEANPFETGVANLTARAALSPSSSLSRQELIGLLLLISVPRETARNSMQGAKP